MFFFVDQRDIFGAAIIPVQHLYIVFLNLPGLFRNMLVGVGNYITEKAAATPYRKTGSGSALPVGCGG